MAIVAWLALFAGAVLVYAGITGASIVDELRRILAGGKAPAGDTGAPS